MTSPHLWQFSPHSSAAAGVRGSDAWPASGPEMIRRDPAGFKLPGLFYVKDRYRPGGKIIYNNLT